MLSIGTKFGYNKYYIFLLTQVVDLSPILFYIITLICKPSVSMNNKCIKTDSFQDRTATTIFNSNFET